MQTKQPWILLFGLSIVAFLVHMDYLAVNLALIPMSVDLHTDLNTIQWTLSAYVITWAILVIPMGLCIDKYGTQHFYLIGLGLFLIASLFAGIAQSAIVLITARILQGIACAISIPALFALLFLNFPENMRGRAMGIISLGGGLGMTLGPFLNGMLLTWLNWRVIFLLNLPLGLLALAIIAFNKKKEAHSPNTSPINITSATLLSSSIVICLYLLSEWHSWSRYPVLYTGLFIFALICLSIFIYTQIKHHNPLIPTKLFTNKAFVACNVGVFLLQYNFTAIMIVATLYLQDVMHFSSLQTSLIYLPLTISFGIFAAISGYWADKSGLRRPTLMGMFIVILGSILFTLLAATTSLWIICIEFAVLGMGLGMAFAGLNTGVVKVVPQQYIGVASSVFLMSCLLGDAFGVACTAIIYQKTSLVKLLQTLGPSIHFAQDQIQQLANDIANIGPTHTSLSTFSTSLQNVIFNETASASSYGINSVMLATFVVSLLAMFCCAWLLRHPWVGQSNLMTSSSGEDSQT